MSGIGARTAKRQDKSGMLRRSLEKLIKLYTDNAHFLYELLQNAEDADATHVKFAQFEDRLEVYHDGRPFTESNFDSLCDVGLSEKAGDLNKIGEFGIGFKSVFSICKTVELHSTPENYREDYSDAASAFSVSIENFTDPVDLEYSPVEHSYTTKFVFFYDVGHSYSGFSTIYELKKKITDRLQDLGVTTLLFMKHLKEIAYEINIGGQSLKGEYLLEKEYVNEHCLIVSALGKNSNENNVDDEKISYLKFSRAIDEDSTRTVDIAFPVVRIGENEFECVKPKSPYISVYFPTKTESKLDFIVQGPYRTTPDRSSIPAEEIDNILLAKKTAALLVDTLKEMRNRGWLNMSFIKILPICKENFETYPLFKPLYDAVRELFSNDAIPIIPCLSGGYVAARYAKIARGEELIKLFDDTLLTELIGGCAVSHWLPTCISENNREYDLVRRYFLELGIPTIRPKSLRSYFEKNPDFLPNQSNSWLVGLYNVLESIPGEFKKDSEQNFLTTEIVKTTEGDFVAPYRKTSDGEYVPNVYIPAGNLVTCPDILFVDETIYNQCRHFFDVVIGLQQPNEYEFLTSDIRRRYDENYEYIEHLHIEDLRGLYKYLDSNTHREEVLSIIKENFLLRCTDGIMRSPAKEKLYLATSVEGIDIFGYLQNIANDVYFIDSELYARYGIENSMLCRFGVINTLLVGEEITSGFLDSKGKGRRPMWHASLGFCWELSIVHLEKVLAYISRNPQAPDSCRKSRTILAILLDNEIKLCGNLYKSDNSLYKSQETCKLIKILRREQRIGWDGRWLYNLSGELVAQNKISRQELDSCIYGKPKQDSPVYELLGFLRSTTDAAAELRKNATKEQLDAYFEEELRSRLGLSFEMLKERLKLDTFNGDTEIDGAFDFPSARIKNWDAIKSHAAEIFCFAIPTKREYVLRHIRTSANAVDDRGYLKNMYRYDGSTQCACQICHNATSHISACQIFKEMEKEIAPFHLCLCPSCAREYASVRNNKAAMSQLRNLILGIAKEKINASDPVKMSVSDIEIWFTQTHIAEIKELLLLFNLSK